MRLSLQTTLIRHSVAFGMFLFGAGAPMYADILEGQVGQNLGGVGSNLLTTNLPSWTFTCSTCVGYGISATGAETVTGGSLGTSASITVTGTPGASLFGITSNDALFTDTLTITDGVGSGVLELTYALDGVISNTGSGLNSSNASLNMTPAGTYFQLDSEGIMPGGYVEIDGNGTYNDTVTYYIPFTYGTALPTELDLNASAEFNGDSTPYTATVNYFNTAAPISALVFGGTPSDPGAENTAAVIGSASGLTYGPNGISGVPEPSSWFLLACAIGFLALAKRRGAFRPTI